MSSSKRGILERLDSGEVIVGDGGFLFCMERRGYVKAGVWTPEATVEHPEAGKIYSFRFRGLIVCVESISTRCPICIFIVET